jgi:anti-anti-sigma factor
MNVISTTPTFDVVTLHHIPVVQIPTHLNKQEADAFRATLRLLYQPQPPRIVLDFSQTLFMDSSGLGTLVSLFKEAQAQGTVLQLWSVTGQVMTILSLSGLDQVLSISAGTDISMSSKPLLPNLTHPSVYSRSKRLIDIVGAMVGLVILAIVFIPITIAIRLDSPGPIFFSQMRCGLMGRRFYLWKFRTMVSNAQALQSQIENQAQGPFFKNVNDPRITRVGGFLRRTSLDELPQFWNVLKGEMSLVGTRPPTATEVEQYDAIFQWQRLDVKPGLTGEWQVHGRSNVTNFGDVVKLDLAYQQKWSLAYDIKLLLKTLQIVCSPKSGAC